MATAAVFMVANKYGDYIQTGWKNILDCVLNLQKRGLLPAHMASDATEDMESTSNNTEQEKPSTRPLSVSQVQLSSTPQKSSSLIGQFSQLLSFETEETKPQPTEEELAAHKYVREIVKDCHIDSIFLERKFLQAESLLQLVNVLVAAVERDEDRAVFCLELLIAIALNNRDTVLLIW